jgi:hypothetical protein
MLLQRGGRSSCLGIGVYEERRWREDEEGGAKLSQTYGFWMLATKPVWIDLERRPGAIRVLLALCFYFQ